MAELVLADRTPVAVGPNPVVTYLARLKSTSQRTMRHALGGIVRHGMGRDEPPEAVAWWLLRYEQTQAIRTRLVEHYTPAGARLRLAALRGVLRECKRLGLMSADDLAAALDLAPVRGTTVPKGRLVRGGELRALLEATSGDGPLRVRDTALLAVAFSGGLRVSEIVGLDMGDYDPAERSLLVRHGKGDKERLAYLEAGACRALERWIETREADPGPLFNPVGRWGRIGRAGRLTDRAVYERLLLLARDAAVAKLTPHDARRTFITGLLDAGVDISTVQRLAGHTNPTTTSAYDRRPEQAKRQAVDLLHFPFQAGG